MYDIRYLGKLKLGKKSFFFVNGICYIIIMIVVSTGTYLIWSCSQPRRVNTRNNCNNQSVGILSGISEKAGTKKYYHFQFVS